MVMAGIKTMNVSSCTTSFDTTPMAYGAVWAARQAELVVSETERAALKGGSARAPHGSWKGGSKREGQMSREALCGLPFGKEERL